MRGLTTGDRRRGYILQEIVVGLVVFAIAVLPVIRGFRMLPQIGAALSQQSRREAWRTASDEAVLQGVDFTQAPMLQAWAPSSPGSLLAGSVTRQDLPSRPGRARITALSSLFKDTAEERSAPMGFEIGAGTVPVAPREDPLPPLAPIKLAAPQLNPLSGTFVPVLSLAPATGAGSGAFLTLRAQGSAASDLVFLRTTSPEVHADSAAGSASVTIRALELAQSVRGRAWTEYAGDAAKDIPVVLADGRTRWLVRDASRTQVFEPSDAIDFVFGLDPGRPAYLVGGVEYASGETIRIDFSQARAIEAGEAPAVLTFPTDVRERFGSDWAEVAPRFTWAVGPFLGDSSAGNTVSFYRREGRALWAASQTLSATPSGLPGMRALAGTWTLERDALQLGPPERITSSGTTDGEGPGWADFSAPLVASLKARVGRPEVNGVESLGSTLSVPLVP